MASRREILGALVAALPLAAQTTAPAPQDAAAKAQADVQQTRQKLAELKVPMNVEPSFQFVP